MLVKPWMFSFCSLYTRSFLLYKVQRRRKSGKCLNCCQPVCVLVFHSTRILDWEWWCLFFRDTSGQGRFCTIFRSYSRGAQVCTQMFFSENLLHSRTKQRGRERKERIWVLHCWRSCWNLSRILKCSTQRSAVPVQTVWYVVKQGWVAAVNVTFPVHRPIHTS